MGGPAEIGSTRPTKAIDSGEHINTVRATFIRWLALGGDADQQLHVHGVQLSGAWIVETLDLIGATLNGNLTLVYCHFDQTPNMLGLMLNGSLNLQSSKLALGLRADGAKITGTVLLRSYQKHRFESLGEIRLHGAKIGGNLECDGASFNVPTSQIAIRADGAQISGSVFFRCNEEYQFESTGQVRLVGTNVGKGLDCSGAIFDVPKAEIALAADGVKISGGVFLIDIGHKKFESKGIVRFTGANIDGILTLLNKANPIQSLDLSHCKVGILQSDAGAWGTDLALDGFTYDSLRGAHWQTSDYLTWLSKQRYADYGSIEEPKYFKPQPWQQLIRVLRKMGYNDEALDIAIAFEQRRYEIGKITGMAKPLHWVFGKLAGYGYKPLRLVNVMIAIWLSFGLCFWLAAYQGVFTPSDPLVFQNSAYDTCRSVDTAGKTRIINNLEPNQVTYNWFTCSKLMGEYTTFSPLTYSLDVILPLVDLGQEKTWGTYIDTAKSNAVSELLAFTPNHIIRLMVWFEIIFGWMASLMLVAVLTGLTDRNKS